MLSVGGDVDDGRQRAVSDLSEREQTQCIGAVQQQVSECSQLGAINDLMHRPQAHWQVWSQRVVHLVALQPCHVIGHGSWVEGQRLTGRSGVSV